MDVPLVNFQVALNQGQYRADDSTRASDQG